MQPYFVLQIYRSKKEACMSSRAIIKTPNAIGASMNIAIFGNAVYFDNTTSSHAITFADFKRKHFIFSHISNSDHLLCRFLQLGGCSPRLVLNLAHFLVDVVDRGFLLVVRQ